MSVFDSAQTDEFEFPHSLLKRERLIVNKTLNETDLTERKFVAQLEISPSLFKRRSPDSEESVGLFEVGLSSRMYKFWTIEIQEKLK